MPLARGRLSGVGNVRWRLLCNYNFFRFSYLEFFVCVCFDLLIVVIPELALDKGQIAFQKASH